MKLCWDNIENIRLTKKGNFRDVVKKQTYHYSKSCKICNEPFLYVSGHNKKFCSKSCSHMNKTKPKGEKSLLWKGGYSKKGVPTYDTFAPQLVEWTEEVRRNKEDSNILEVRCFKCGEWYIPTLNNVNNRIQHLKGNKYYTNKINLFICSIRCKLQYQKDISKKKYYNNDIPTYDTYAHQLEWCEEVRRNEDDPNVLEVKCFKCGEWYVPKSYNIKQRIQYLKGNEKTGEHRFYCSDQCKNSCSIFNKPIDQLLKQDAIRAGRLKWLELTREVQPELRSMVLERNEHKCVKCGSIEDLQCHHIYPVNIEPLLSADIDNCITLCKECHIKVHKEVDGCRYSQLHIKEC